MNIEQANAIPMPEILQKLGFVPEEQKGSELAYKSPFRQEKTASFKVNTFRNVWYDHGETAKRGGKAFDFVLAWLKHTGEDDKPKDGLRWCENMGFAPSHVRIEEPSDPSKGFTLKKVSEIHSKGLEHYLTSRGISMEIAKRYLKEARIFNGNTGKTFYALSLENVDEGHELRNAAFKGCIGSKSLSFFRAAKNPATEIHVFEGAFDFLSAVENAKDKELKGDAIILNTVNRLEQAITYIKTNPYKKLNSWMDNDTAGKKAEERLKSIAQECNLAFQRKNKTYAPHKDVNAWHMHKLKLDPKSE
ncbi:toprim domain-containing protein [Flavobacterium sp. 3HN19-14]|uniref:toprim domain-containing protein n=1 Tax=Flavobacterium sp. 3HN19-14 TaxID=3448133 RepID=UPI003EE06618